MQQVALLSGPALCLLKLCGEVTVQHLFLHVIRRVFTI